MTATNLPSTNFPSISFTANNASSSQANQIYANPKDSLEVLLVIILTLQTSPKQEKIFAKYPSDAKHESPLMKILADGGLSPVEEGSELALLLRRSWRAEQQRFLGARMDTPGVLEIRV